jgi:hypothetical protein
VDNLRSIFVVTATERYLAQTFGRRICFDDGGPAGLCGDPDGECETESAMSEIDPQRKKVALLAVAICTLNMPLVVLLRHLQGYRYFSLFVICYAVAMVTLSVYTMFEVVKLKRRMR